MDGPSRFSALHDRNFRIFWIGQGISLSGAWMQSVAQGWLVYSLTKSPVYLGLTAMALSAPVLLFSLIGGVVADKVDKRTLLIITQALSMLPAFLLGALSANGEITVSRIMVLAFLLGTVNAFDIPARQAYVSELVHRRQLENALALNSVVFNATRIIGPVMAGFTIAAFGTAACFLINAFSFLAGIAALLMISTPSKEEVETRRRTGLVNLMAELREGFSYVTNERDVFRVLLLVAVISLFGIPFVPLLPVFADTILNVGPQGLGLLAGCSGVGSLAAALVVASVGDIRDKRRPMVAAGVVFAFCLLLFSRSHEYHVSLLALLFAGGGIVIFLALVNSFIQHACPDEIRGRVMGFHTLVLIGMAPLGNAVMGLLAATFGTAGALSLSASICLAAVLLLALPLSRLG